MSGHKGTSNNQLPEDFSSQYISEERLHELEIINKVLIEASQAEDIDRICEIIGESVHELNKNCYAIILLYDNDTDLIRIKAATGIEGIKEKFADIPNFSFDDISFSLEDMGVNTHLLTSGKLERFPDGFCTLLEKKIPYDLCKKLEKDLGIGSSLVVGFLNEENKIFGSLFILLPEEYEVENSSAIETITAYALKKIQTIKTEKALLEAESKFELLFKQAPLSYQSLDKNGYFIDVNDTWLDTLGYSQEEVKGKRFEDFLTPESAEKFETHLFKFKLKGKVQGVEFEAIRKDGKRINIVLDGKITYDEHGNFKQTHCVFKDITAQKEAEKKAFENEKLLRSMMDAITESTILLKPDGTVAYINETAAKRLKLTTEKCIGNLIDSTTSEEILKSRKKKFDIVLSERKPLKFEDTRDGIHFFHNVYPVYDSANQLSHFAIFSMDITEYKKAEEKLKWELAVNRALAGLADALIDSEKSIDTIANIVLSASKELTESEHGYVSSIDPETGDNICHTMTGMMEKCRLLKDTNKIVFPKGPDGLYPKLHGHALNTKKGFYTNFPGIHPNSEGIPKDHIDLENLLSVPATVRDELTGQISLANSKKGYSDRELEAIRKIAALYALAIQQKRASIEIQYRDNLLKSILESTVDGILVVDRKHKILFLNSKTIKILKIPDSLFNTQIYEELLNFVLSEVKYPEEYLLKSYDLFRSNKIDQSYIQFNDERTIERISTPLVINGILEGTVLSFRDVTEKVEAEKALIKAKIHAEEANRTKSEFLATMSHELRTPLNSVIGFSDILRAQLFGPLNERQLKYLNNISISGNHLLNLINDILDISRIESGDVSLYYETMSVKELFEDVRNIAIPLASSKNIFLEFSAKPADLKIYADKIKVKQILHNLVTNALKFTPNNGHVNVWAKMSADTIEISVKDNGIGIPEDKQKIIFEPFKQLDSSLSRNYSGTGLGLMIVKKFIEMHEGEIRVESELTKGSKFTIILPIKKKQELKKER